MKADLPQAAHVHVTPPVSAPDFFACTQYSVAEIEDAQRKLGPVIIDLRGAHRDRQLASFTINADAVQMLANQMAVLAASLRSVAGKKIAETQQ